MPFKSEPEPVAVCKRQETFPCFMCGGRDFCLRKCVNILSVVCWRIGTVFSLSPLSVSLCVFDIVVLQKKVTRTALAFPDKSDVQQVTVLDGDETGEMRMGDLFMSITVSQSQGKSSESEEGKWH